MKQGATRVDWKTCPGTTGWGTRASSAWGWDGLGWPYSNTPKGYWGDRARWVQGGKIRRNRHKLNIQSFLIFRRKNSSLWGLSDTAQSLPREAVMSPSLEVFKTWLDICFGNLDWSHRWPRIQQEDGLEITCSYSIILSMWKSHLQKW